MEDLPLGIIAALVPEFAVKDLPLGRTLMRYIYGLQVKLGDFYQYTHSYITFYITAPFI